MARDERYVEKLHVHLEEHGGVEVTSHPSVPPTVYAVLRDVIIHNWRYTGGDADRAKWTSQELDRVAEHAEEEE